MDSNPTADTECEESSAARGLEVTPDTVGAESSFFKSFAMGARGYAGYSGRRIFLLQKFRNGGVLSFHNFNARGGRDNPGMSPCAVICPHPEGTQIERPAPEENPRARGVCLGHGETNPGLIGSWSVKGKGHIRPRVLL